jgi:endonuclease III
MWFLASILFGAMISERIAANTYRAFLRNGLDSPEKILSAGWNELVRGLDEGGYVRYDFSTATKLLGIMRDLKERYGSLEELRQQSKDTRDLAEKLQEFKGIGPTTAQIFLRELRVPWKVNPEISSRALEMAQCLDLDLTDLEGEELSRAETALIKLKLRYCKRKSCPECTAVSFCRDGAEIHKLYREANAF